MIFLGLIQFSGDAALTRPHQTGTSPRNAFRDSEPGTFRRDVEDDPARCPSAQRGNRESRVLDPRRHRARPRALRLQRGGRVGGREARSQGRGRDPDHLRAPDFRGHPPGSCQLHLVSVEGEMTIGANRSCRYSEPNPVPPRLSS